MNPELDRRTFLKRAGQAGGLVFAGGMLETLLAACGGNVSTTTGGGGTVTPGATVVPSAGLKTPGTLQWGADYVSGAPYVFKDPTNPTNLIGFEVEIAVAMAQLMGGIQQKQVEVCYSNLEQALLANQIDMVMNGWEKTTDREKTELFSDAYYRYGQQVIVRKDDTRFANVVPKTVADLEGYTVGTGSGYKAETLMLADPKIHVKSYTGNIAFSDLVQKKLDAFLPGFPHCRLLCPGYRPRCHAYSTVEVVG